MNYEPTDMTLADLVRLTHVRRRSLQLWSELGLLKARPQTVRAGTGVHKVFPHAAVETVRILTLLHDLGIENNHKEKLLGLVRADAKLRSALEHAREALVR